MVCLELPLKRTVQSAQKQMVIFCYSAYCKMKKVGLYLIKSKRNSF